MRNKYQITTFLIAKTKACYTFCYTLLQCNMTRWKPLSFAIFYGTNCFKSHLPQSLKGLKVLKFQGFRLFYLSEMQLPFGHFGHFLLCFCLLRHLKPYYRFLYSTASLSVANNISSVTFLPSKVFPSIRYFKKFPCRVTEYL